MIKDLRIRLAAGLLLGVVSVVASGQAQAANRTEVRYACDGRQSLIIQRDKSTALVRFVNGSYKLRRKASSIGEKYVSSTAALIIDGRSAVFVSEDRLQFGNCTEAVSMASAS